MAPKPPSRSSARLATASSLRRWAHLSNHDFRKIDRVVLSRADLTGATLNGANFSGMSLHGARLHGACLAGADLTRTYLPPGLMGVHDVVYLGQPDGWSAFAWHKGPTVWVNIGCRSMTLTQAKRYWRGKIHRREVYAALAYAAAIAKNRNWK